MAWLEIHTVLCRHRKILGLAHDLRQTPEQTMGNVIALWLTVLEQQEDGDLSKWPDDMIVKSMGLRTDVSRAIGLLYEHCLLDKGTRLVHDWLEYAGKLLKSKYASGKAKKVPQNRAKLEAIWEKHGKILDAEHGARVAKARAIEAPHGLPEGVPRVTQGEPEGFPRHITQQNKTKPPNQERVAVGKETFNPGMHHDLAAQAKRIVDAFMAAVGTSHRSTKAAAVTELAQLFLDDPGVRESQVMAGIKAYARECNAKNAPPDKRCSALQFIRDRRWQSYDGDELNPPEPKRQSVEEMIGK